MITVGWWRQAGVVAAATVLVLTGPGVESVLFGTIDSESVCLAGVSKNLPRLSFGKTVEVGDHKSHVDERFPGLRILPLFKCLGADSWFVPANRTIVGDDASLKRRVQVKIKRVLVHNEITRDGLPQKLSIYACRRHGTTFANRDGGTCPEETEGNVLDAQVSTMAHFKTLPSQPSGLFGGLGLLAIPLQLEEDQQGQYECGDGSQEVSGWQSDEGCQPLDAVDQPAGFRIVTIIVGVSVIMLSVFFVDRSYNAWMRYETANFVGLILVAALCWIVGILLFGGGVGE